MKEIGKNILLVIASFFAVFLILEISLRIYYGNQPVFLYPQVSHIHTVYGYKPTPNQKSYTLVDTLAALQGHLYPKTVGIDNLFARPRRQGSPR